MRYRLAEKRGGAGPARPHFAQAYLTSSLATCQTERL